MNTEKRFFSPNKTKMSRREVMKAGVAGAAALGALGVGTRTVASAAEPSGKAAQKGRINHSIVLWCYESYWNMKELCQVANRLGSKSIELVDPKDWPLLKEHGLVCALANSHWFDEGMNNPKHQPMCIGKMRKAIDACSEFGFPNVITFTGFRGDISDDDGIENCVRGYKKIVGYAEKKGVTLCLEMLNSRVTEEMKGHPGYQGDHTDYVMEIIDRVGSPALKLLFDIYHVQVMDGDVIRRIRQYKDSIGHYHTAGNPGRGELDAHQEIGYPAIMEEILKSGFDRYVAQEFLPVRDPYTSLHEAIALCDV